MNTIISGKTFNPLDIVGDSSSSSSTGNGLNTIQVNNIVDNKTLILKNEILGDASSSFDTLKEIQDSLGSNTTLSATLTNAIGLKLDKTGTDSLQIEKSANNATLGVILKNTTTNAKLSFGTTLGQSSYNPLVIAGDSAIIFSDGQGTSEMNSSGAICITPHYGTNSGIRIDNTSLKLGSLTDLKMSDNTFITQANLKKVNFLSTLSSDVQTQLNNKTGFGANTFTEQQTIQKATGNNTTNHIRLLNGSNSNSLQIGSSVYGFNPASASETNLILYNNDKGLVIANHDGKKGVTFKNDFIHLGESDLKLNDDYVLNQPRLRQLGIGILYNSGWIATEVHTLNNIVNNGAVNVNQVYTFTHNLGLYAPLKYTMLFTRNYPVYPISGDGKVILQNTFTPTNNNFPSQTIHDITASGAKIGNQKQGYLLEYLNANQIRVRWNGEFICEVIDTNGNGYSYYNGGRICLVIHA